MSKAKVIPIRPRLIPLSEASEQLSMTRQTVMNYVKKGQLKCVRFATNAVWFRPEHLEEFIDKHTEQYKPLRVIA